MTSYWIYQVWATYNALKNLVITFQNVKTEKSVTALNNGNKKTIFLRSINYCLCIARALMLVNIGGKDIIKQKTPLLVLQKSCQRGKLRNYFLVFYSTRYLTTYCLYLPDKMQVFDA